MKLNILRHPKKYFLEGYLDISLYGKLYKKKAELFFLRFTFASETIIGVSVNPKKWVLSLQNMFHKPLLKHLFFHEKSHFKKIMLEISDYML